MLEHSWLALLHNFLLLGSPYLKHHKLTTFICLSVYLSNHFSCCNIIIAISKQKILTLLQVIRKTGTYDQSNVILCFNNLDYSLLVNIQGFKHDFTSTSFFLT